MARKLRYALLLTFGIFLLTSGFTYGQKQDKMLKKAEQLLKGYTPPQEKNPPQTETPNEAWQRAYRGKYTNKQSDGVQPAVPTENQYRKKGSSREIQKQLLENSKLQTPAGIKMKMDELMREDLRNGKGESWELQQRGIHIVPSLSKEEMDKQYDEFIKQDAQKNGRMKSQLQSQEEIRKQDEQKKKTLPTSTEEIRTYIEEQMKKDSRTQTTGRLTTASGAVANGLFSGTIFNDKNHNGVRDSLEDGVAGWAISVYEYNTGITLQTTTDSLGTYYFIDSAGAGTYYVYQPLLAGWYITSNFSGYPYVYVNNDTVTGKDFGGWQITPRSISGMKFNDINHNATRDSIDTNSDGAKDSLEPGLAGWTINLYEYNTGAFRQMVTDSLGNYHFDSLTQVSQYHVYETSQSGWIQTVGDFYPVLNYDSITGLDFGNRQALPNYFSGMKFNDLNNNGQLDNGEPGLAGWIITVSGYYYGGSWSDTTDSNGYYLIATAANPPDYYFVNETQQDGWYQTKGGYNYVYRTALGDTGFSYDFGNRLTYPNYITGIKFNDINHNGVQDAGEPGLADWIINVNGYNHGGSWSDTTDSNGVYFIATHAYPDYYFITETHQTGWLQTTPDYTYQYLYATGDTSHYNFGNWLVPPSAIRGYKFSDLNDNGYWDEGEPGLAGWVIHAYNEDTHDTLTTVTDSTGAYAFYDLSWVHYYQVYEVNQADWIKTLPGGGYWRPYVAGDTVENIDFGNYLPTPQYPLRVNTMPSNGTSVLYANAVVTVPTMVWGNVHGGLVPLRYYLDYGDGTIDSGIVANRRVVGSLHTYTGAGPKVVVLKIVDANDSVDIDQSIVKVYAASSPQIRTNIAIEKGLFYLYNNQYPDGHWYDNSNNVASTGAALLAFEENGHKALNDINSDIYAEYVQLGLNYLLSSVYTYSISTQPAGNPDANGNGLGAYLVNETYANGIGFLAIIGAHSSGPEAQADTIRTGTYNGKTFYDLVADAMDQWAFSQTDAGSSGRGGWQYGVATPNYGNSDNSTTQWATLDLEAAQNSWGITIPQFVKDELLLWLQYSQDNTGGFGYSGPNSWNNITKTAAGIGQYALLGYTTDSIPVVNALSFINSQWDYTGGDDNGWAQHTSGNTYAMYGIAKGMRVINHRSGNQYIGLHDWYAEYVSHLLDNPTWKQNNDGSWPRSSSYPTQAMGDPLNSSLAILVLTQGVVVPPPVAAIASIGALPPHTSFDVDGSNSFHQDPNKSIVEMLWDWNAANGIDWKHPDASGPKPNNPGYADTGMYSITLRVKDNSDPPLYGFASVNVHITLDHHPPVAVAIPPDRGSGYAGKVGEPIFLDGSASYSPDYPKDSVIAWRWDLNGNGNYYDSSDATTDTVTMIFNTPYEGQVGLRVYDTKGDSSNNTAYINIVAAKTDLLVQQFTVEPKSVLAGDSVHFFAVVKNNDTSNTNGTHVLLRFYDDNPLTIGNQLGGDFYVDLPVSAIETVQTSVRLPIRFRGGERRFFAFLDANNHLAEWNELNNFALSYSTVTPIRPVSIFDRECLNFATLPLDSSLTLSFTIQNVGNDTLFIDSLVTKVAEFVSLNGAGDSVFPGNSETFYVKFTPHESGMYLDSLKIYNNDEPLVVGLAGQGELEATGSGYRIFTGLLRIDDSIAPQYTGIGAFRTNGDIIRATLVDVPPESAAVHGYNYALKITEGQAGIMDGDTIIFIVNTAICEILPMPYCQSPVIYHPVLSPDSATYPMDLTAVHIQTQSIHVTSGVNAVSWNVIPENPLTGSVFYNLLLTGKVNIILDYFNNGHGNQGYNFYIPQLGIYNPMQLTDFRKGYFVKLANDVVLDSLMVTGLPVCSTFPIHVDSGYNFVSYLPAHSDSITHALNSLKQGNLVSVMDWNTAGQNFDTYPSGNLTVMYPNRGYFVGVDSSDVLVYPGQASSMHPLNSKTVRASHPNALSFANGLARAMFIYGLNVKTNSVTVSSGTNIKAIDGDGVVCGTGSFFADGVFGLAIYGDDPSTPQDEGATDAEQVKIFIDNKLVSQRVMWTAFGDVAPLDGNLIVTGVTSENSMPHQYTLSQNYPNPFNPITSIKYELPKESNVTLKIYNMLGAEVRTLVSESQGTGYYQIAWDGRNNAGHSVASGIYTYQLVATSGTKTFTQTKKMLLLK